MFELYGCPTHYGVGAKGLIKSIDYLTENFKNLQMNKKMYKYGNIHLHWK